ncbi:hypothetical protein ACHAW5_009166 [Stephanodiscus triporus]|uniref:Uncharacterized protein n=1 Tax=Stephanodiscus triporus TaxID=2934178 RepID=A0ABD3PA24_9STRA
MTVLPREHTDALHAIIADFLSSHVKVLKSSNVHNSRSEDLQCKYATLPEIYFQFRLGLPWFLNRSYLLFVLKF